MFIRCMNFNLSFEQEGESAGRAADLCLSSFFIGHPSRASQQGSKFRLTPVDEPRRWDRFGGVVAASGRLGLRIQPVDATH